jgi:sugar lactone lactonase YvrE
VDDTGALWVLDPAAPMLEAVVKGGPKLVKFDLATNQPAQMIAFPESVAPENSYLNDVRVDTKTGHAYLTESSLGGLVVVDLKSGKSRRVLEKEKSTKAEPEVELTVDGLKPKDPKTGKSPQFQSDGIALDAAHGYLYWHALTGYTLWRVKTEDLRNEALTEAQLAAKVERVAKTVAPDGMLEGPDGSVYLTAIEKNGIVRFDPQTQQSTTVIEDKKLQWPDSLSWGPDHWLYVTASQIHRMPKFNGGVDQRNGQPFRVLRVKVP